MSRGTLAVAVAALLSCGPAAAANCDVQTTGVVFGTYDPFSAIPLDGVGQLSVLCDEDVPLRVGLNQGTGAFEHRVMSSGNDQLHYNLFTDATRTLVWGDGTDASDVSGSGLRLDLSIFGRIFPRQNVGAGVYRDTLTITVSY